MRLLHYNEIKIRQGEIEMGNAMPAQRSAEEKRIVEYRDTLEKRRKSELRRRKKLKSKLIGIVWQIIFIIFVLVLYIDVKLELREVMEALSDKVPFKTEETVKSDDQDTQAGVSRNTQVDYVSLHGMDEVDKPVERSQKQVQLRLQELAADNKVIAGILEDTTLYPDKLLEALANNPEMASFVAGYPEADKLKAAGEGFTDTEKNKSYPLFLQWDPRWGYVSYGDDSSIALSGCGPTSLSMVLYYLTGDETLTPDNIAAYSMKNGYYMSGTGTSWSLMKDVPALHGIKVSQPGISEQSMKRELDKGNVLICSMRKGDFTTGGHFIVIYGYDEDGFKVNDANCVARSRQSWTFDRIGTQIKSIWSYSK